VLGGLAYRFSGFLALEIDTAVQSTSTAAPGETFPTHQTKFTVGDGIDPSASNPRHVERIERETSSNVSCGCWAGPSGQSSVTNSTS